MANGPRLPIGAQYLGESNGIARFTVSMPADDDGYYGRECPACGQYFKLDAEIYAELADECHLWCVYCGHTSDSGDFITTQQYERAIAVVPGFARHLLDRAFSSMARRSRSITYRSEPFFPAPLPGIHEERLIRGRDCSRCSARYAVFGDHRFCPLCGLLDALAVATDALEAERLRLDVLGTMPHETVAQLRESGVIDRTLSDAIKNVVAIVESMADRTFVAAVPGGNQLVKGKGNVFQRLDDIASLYSEHLSIDLREALGEGWDVLVDVWAARHVLTHCDGIVDDKYLRTVPKSTLKVGQRLQITETMCRQALTHAQALCETMAR